MLFPTKIVNKIVILYFISMSLPSFSLNLSQDIVIQKVLKNSLEYQKIQANKEAQLQNLSNAESFLDWKFFIKANLESKEINTLNFFESPQQEQKIFSSGIEKFFLTGTQLKIQYLHFQSDRKFTPEFKKINTSPTTTFTQRIELSIEQDLLRNIFGYEDRIRLNIASMQSEIQKINLQEEIEDLIIRSIQQFWSTYINYLALTLKTSKKKDYEELTQITLKKSRYGYIRPGELSQIKAELEKAKQELILQKISYENELKKLLNLLNIKDKTKVTFKFNRVLPPPPILKKNLKQTPRTVALLQKNLSIKQEQLKIYKSSTWPTLKLFGSYGFGGYETDLSSTFDSFTSRNNESHSIGVKMVYALPATRTRRRRISFAEQSVEESQLEVEITKKSFEQIMEHTQKSTKALYSVLKKSDKIDRLRSQSYKEIRKAFLQGRLDVFQLISAKELTLLSKMEKAKLKSQYYQTLALTYAMNDQLTSY